MAINRVRSGRNPFTTTTTLTMEKILIFNLYDTQIIKKIIFGFYLIYVNIHLQLLFKANKKITIFFTIGHMWLISSVFFF